MSVKYEVRDKGRYLLGYINGPEEPGHIGDGLNFAVYTKTVTGSHGVFGVFDHITLEWAWMAVDGPDSTLELRYLMLQSYREDSEAMGVLFSIGSFTPRTIWDIDIFEVS